MPAWWSKRSSRTKSDSEKSGKGLISSKNENNRRKETDTHSVKARIFEDVLSRNSPRSSRDDFAPAHVVGENNNLSGFSGFDSASSLEKGHPLPRPLDDHQCQGHGSGSGSVSSVGSSSSDEHNHGGVVDHAHAVFRGHIENRSSPLMRSPGPALRANSSTSAPLQTRGNGCGSNLDSPSSKLEDRRSESHPLPLPPGSPTSLPTPRSPNMSESSTSISSKWRKGRLLGRGTFGHVYLGFNSENGQMCAIKEVKVVSDDRSSKESLRQLNQEIALLSQLSHANIVQYYGSDLNEERLSVYLEYVSGGSIHKLLQEYGAFEEPVVQNYTRQILLGLAYLHGRNTAHRDIKGANILVDPNGEIKLADFGMAKHIASSSSMLSFKGSPYWMAPEVVMNTNGYSLPVDIWSLGCTVLEMATSKPPWSQYEGVAAIFKIGNSKDSPEIPEHLSPEAKNFIHLCLQREPSLRPTANQLLTHPFVRNQTTLRAANVNITRQAFPRTFDGSRTPTALEMHSNRTNNSSFDIPRILTSPRDAARTITTSLPVSPSSSPMRQQGDEAMYRNFFLSPPHPSYNTSAIGKSSQNYSDYDYLAIQLRPASRISLDLDRQRFGGAQVHHAKSPSRMM